MLEFLKAVILGVVQGVTEWLPVSSTGHMIIINEFLKLDVSDEFMSIFTVVIQLGSIIAVLLLFWNRVFPIEFVPEGTRIVKKKVRRRDGRMAVKKVRKTVSSPSVNMDILALWIRIIVGCIPAVIVGLPFDDLFEELFYKPIPIALALILFGIGFIVIELLNKKRRPTVKNVYDITIGTAFIIGLFQLVAAIFPGTSRSGATILGALLLGVSRTAATEFSFFMAIPVMFGASFLKVLKFILSGASVTGFEIFLLITGMFVAFVVSVLVIRYLMSFIRKHDFRVFGYYRIVLGLIVLLYFLLIA